MRQQAHIMRISKQCFFFFNDTATTEIYTVSDTLSLHDALPLLCQAHAWLALGASAVLIKGGHGSAHEAVDLLVSAGGSPRRLVSARSARTHRGTGCALASGIAAGLAAGLELGEACARAKRQDR